jgi:hypothetical protein
MPFTTGPFTVIPVVANHGDSPSPSSVIYIVKYQDKIIMGWDFLSLPNVDENSQNCSYFILPVYLQSPSSIDYGSL